MPATLLLGWRVCVCVEEEEWEAEEEKEAEEEEEEEEGVVVPRWLRCWFWKCFWEWVRTCSGVRVLRRAEIWRQLLPYCW